MIHQLIFASPKPGLSEREFQNYWLKVHAVEYAAKIPQIERYLVSTRIDADRPDPAPLFGGVAEIWLADEQSQLSSLQSREFIDGARRDEPNWAAFWSTLFLETTGQSIVDAPDESQPTGVKLYMLMKRREGLPLAAFREKLAAEHAYAVASLPGLRRYVQCVVRDGMYVVGESRFDAVDQWWFDDRASLRRAFESSEYRRLVAASFDEICEPKYLFSLAAEEHWIIGPEPRSHVNADTVSPRRNRQWQPQ